MSLQEDAAYHEALTGIASGATRDEVRGWVASHYETVREEHLDKLLDDALDGALSSGIEREDIDESWL